MDLIIFILISVLFILSSITYIKVQKKTESDPNKETKWLSLSLMILSGIIVIIYSYYLLSSNSETPSVKNIEENSKFFGIRTFKRNHFLGSKDQCTSSCNGLDGDAV